MRYVKCALVDVKLFCLAAFIEVIAGPGDGVVTPVAGAAGRWH